MRFKGKIIGGLIGLLFFGPIGAAFGFIAGHLYDIGYFRVFIEAAKGNVHTHIQKIFFENTFKVMGHIAKSDGHVSQNEINAARQIMRNMRLNEAMQQQAVDLFNLGKQPDFNLDSALLELRQVCLSNPIFAQLFLDIQWQIANADGPASSEKKQTLQYISDRLGISGFQFYGHQHTQNHYQRQSYYQQRNMQSDQLSLDEAYQLLGISKQASNDDIKQAYRRLMSQHHPDKLIAKGLPPEMIKLATQKTQQIKKAYETLKKVRGI